MDMATALVSSQIMQVGISLRWWKKYVIHKFGRTTLTWECQNFLGLGQGLPTANGKSGITWNLLDSFNDWQDIENKNLKSINKTQLTNSYLLLNVSVPQIYFLFSFCWISEQKAAWLTALTPNLKNNQVAFYK